MNAVIQHQFSDIERMAIAFAASKLFGAQTPDQALALCLIAQAEGRHPASAAQDYHIIKGRPSKKADAMLRDFIAGGGKVEWHALTDEIADATFSHPSGGSARIEWTFARAKKAQLTTDMWIKYPRQMLRSRVVSEGVRTIYPMATSGMYVPEEVQEFTPTESVPPAAIADMRDTTPPKTAPNGVKRLSSARAKDLGLDVTIKDAINACELGSDLAAWEVDFDKYTAELPLSWLDSIRNHIILRAEEIAAEAMMPDILTEQFRDTIGSGD